jgi:hypothetical protein
MTRGGKLIGQNDPDHQEKVIKFNELLANCVMYSTALDITDAANDIAAEGQPVDLDDLATVSPTSPTFRSTLAGRGRACSEGFRLTSGRGRGRRWRAGRRPR